jgi:hypothetical protein
MRTIEPAINTLFVTPAKAGVRWHHKQLDSCFRRNDGESRSYGVAQGWKLNSGTPGIILTHG